MNSKKRPKSKSPRPNGQAEREFRLAEIRRDAEEQMRASGKSPAGLLPAPVPYNGYYQMPLLKSPQWSWEIPLYLFTGGFAGAAAVIAASARLLGANAKLVRDARVLATVGAAISPALLIADLGTPRRFLNMFRVFKAQSPMSIGSWTLLAFSTSIAATTVTPAVFRQNGHKGPLRLAAAVAEPVSAATGLVMTAYTGVLIGATAVPVWNEHVALLPAHFAASGLASAVSLLELLGHRALPLNLLGAGAAAVELAIGARIELNHRPVNRPLKRGLSGWLTRLGGLLSGPLPLALRVLAATTSYKSRSARLRRAAAVSALAGSLLTRFAWLLAGKSSARDFTLPLQLPASAEHPPA